MDTPKNPATANLEVSDTAQYQDQRRPLLRALRFGTIALVALLIDSLMGWGAVSGAPGLWAALMGVGIGGGFVLLTAISVLVTSNSTPTATMAVVLGGWLIKMVVIVLILLALRDATFYDSTAFGVTTIAALVVALGAEAMGVLSVRTAYIQQS